MAWILDRSGRDDNGTGGGVDGNTPSWTWCFTESWETVGDLPVELGTEYFAGLSVIDGFLELETLGGTPAGLGAGSFARLSVLPRLLELSSFRPHVASPVGRRTFAGTGGGAAFFNAA